MKCKCCNQEIEKAVIEEDVPVLVGVTNIRLAFENENPAEIGTKVYKFEGSYLIYFITYKSDTIARKYKIQDLEPYITLI